MVLSGSEVPGVPGAVPRFQDAHRLLARLHEDLRHQVGVVGFGEDRLDPVRLRADAIDEADVLLPVGRVDVVPAGEHLLVLRRGVGRREQHAVRSFDRFEVLTDDQRGEVVRRQPRIELRHMRCMAPLTQSTVMASM